MAIVPLGITTAKGSNTPSIFLYKWHCGIFPLNISHVESNPIHLQFISALNKVAIFLIASPDAYKVLNSY